jgi:hypothetical protein
MKAVLEFTLPEDREEHEMALAAGRLASVISETMNHLRSWEKYGHPFETADEVIAAIRAIVHDEIDEQRVRGVLGDPL